MEWKRLRPDDPFLVGAPYVYPKGGLNDEAVESYRSGWRTDRGVHIVGDGAWADAEGNVSGGEEDRERAGAGYARCNGACPDDGGLDRISRRHDAFAA